MPGSGGGLGSGGELHPRTGRLVSLSACGRTARRQQPGQEFNHGLVLSREPLRDGRVFTVRIDRKVRSEAGGTEIGGGWWEGESGRHGAGQSGWLASTAAARAPTCGALGTGRRAGGEHGEETSALTGKGTRTAGVSSRPRGRVGTPGFVPRNG